MEFKDEMYKGVGVRFEKLNSGRFENGARPLKRGHTQFLGMGRTKQEAFEDYKDSVDRIDRAGNWK